MHTDRIQIDLGGLDPAQLQHLMGNLAQLATGVQGRPVHISHCVLATEGQLEDARAAVSEDACVDDDAGVRYGQNPSGTDAYHVQVWMPVVGGEQPLTLDRVRLAAADGDFSERPGFAERALAWLEQEWCAGHFMGYDDLVDALGTYRESETGATCSPDPEACVNCGEVHSGAQHFTGTGLVCLGCQLTLGQWGAAVGRGAQAARTAGAMQARRAAGGPTVDGAFDADPERP